MQAAAMQIIYKGVFQWFLKLIVGVQFTDCRTLVESQTRSSRRLFRENPLSGFHQQLFHQYASYQKKRGKRFGARSDP